MNKTHKLFLDLNLEGKPVNADSQLFVGRDKSSNSLLHNSDIYKKALSKFLVGKSLNLKLSKLISLINDKGHHIEVIQKSSVGKNLYNFIRESKTVASKEDIPNIAFIIRVGDISESVVPANTIILTVSFKKEAKIVNGVRQIFIFESLTSIQLVKLPENVYGHGSAVLLDKLTIITEYKNEDIQLKQRDFNSISGLKKAFDLYKSSNSKIQLKEQAHFIQKFCDFLRSKESNSMTPYFVGDIGTKKLEEGKKYEFLTVHKEKQLIEKDDKYYIGANNDYSSKIGVRVLKTEDGDFSDLVNEQIKAEENKQARLQELLKDIEGLIKTENQSKISNKKLMVLKEKEIWEKGQKLDEADRLVNSAKEKVGIKNNVLKELLQVLKIHQEKGKSLDIKFKKISDEISLKNSEAKHLGNKKIKNIKKEEKLSKIKDSLKVLQATEKQIKESSKTIQAEISICSEKVADSKSSLELETSIFESFKVTAVNAKKDLTKIEGNIKDIGNLIKMSTSKISDLGKRIKSINKDYEKSIANINLFKEKEISFNDNELILSKIRIVVLSSERDKFIDKNISVEYSTPEDIIFRNETQTYFSDFDAGLNSKFRRFDQTIRAYERGSYKSPYAALSLEKPDVSVKVEKDVHSSINLNEFQQQALNASANSHFASFLQGPPGTGKTQVIASAMENEISNGGNVLISSSSNAAINNAMERMNGDASNPNVFFLRHSNNIDKINEAREFTSPMLYSNFIKRLDGFVSKNSTSEEIDLSLMETLSGKLLARKFVPTWYYEKYISQVDSLSELEYFRDRFDVGDLEDAQAIKEELEDVIGSNRRPSMRENCSLLDEYIKKLSNRVVFEKEDTFESYFEKLKNYSVDSSNHGLFNSRLKNLSKKFNSSELNTEKSKDFADFLFNNSYINVIGITTTSKLVIKQTGGNRERELFVDYPINFAIIDEISKSVTPEILSIAKLADRFMFAGDYRQLPPNSEISKKLIEEFRRYCLENFNEESIKDQTIMAFGINDEKKFRKSIEDLLAISLFTNQVNAMKRSKKENTSYTALKKQYRFNSVINELVNLTYDTNEALVPGKKDKEFNKYETGIKNLSTAFVTIVDTSFISYEFANILNKTDVIEENIKEGQEAFDHRDDLFAKDRVHGAQTNQYNAYVISRIVENLKSKNNTHFAPEKLGVIAMSKPQAWIIKRELEGYEGTKDFAMKIKVDTVDNFQGQERDIIILDLVRAKGKLESGVVTYGGRNVKFYRKPERINVAVSRAQSKLIIVGAINKYLAPEISSEVYIDNSYKSINLFDEWKDIVSVKGEVIPWEKF